MAREAFLKQDAPAETIQYAYSAAVSAGEVLFVANLGVLIATAAYAADATGTYWIRVFSSFLLPRA